SAGELSNNPVGVDDLFDDDDEKPIVNPTITKTEPTSSFDSDIYSGLSLFNFDYQELPKLIDPIFPQIGLASLVGSSDTGKSTFLRQLAISIALGLDKFVGYKLNPIHRNVIFISTEDDPVSTSISIKKPVLKLVNETKRDLQLLNH